MFQFEAIPESLKNMLLVMSTAGIFEYNQDFSETAKPDQKTRQYSALWQVNLIVKIIINIPYPGYISFSIQPSTKYLV